MFSQGNYDAMPCLGEQSSSSASDSAPSEARKRGSGGGSPRKHDDLLTGPSDLDVSLKAVMELCLALAATSLYGRRLVKIYLPYKL
jgi:hypothetical protein